MRSNHEPSRFRPHFKSESVSESRCVAAVHAGRIGFHQCSNKRRPGSEWCSVHEPPVESGEPDVLWCVERAFDGKLFLRSVVILKETEKQITLKESLSGFDHHTRVLKEEGHPSAGGRTPAEAARRFLAEKERELLIARNSYERAADIVERSKALLASTEE